MCVQMRVGVNLHVCAEERLIVTCPVALQLWAPPLLHLLLHFRRDSRLIGFCSVIGR